MKWFFCSALLIIAHLSCAMDPRRQESSRESFIFGLMQHVKDAADAVASDARVKKSLQDLKQLFNYAPDPKEFFDVESLGSVAEQEEQQLDTPSAGNDEQDNEHLLQLQAENQRLRQELKEERKKMKQLRKDLLTAYQCAESISDQNQ